MFTGNIHINNKSLRIIVAPLDWGLGHATRCIPIIEALQKAGAQVFIGAEGNIAAVLKKEFPSLQILPLSGYAIRYSEKKKWFKWILFAQFFKIRKAIQAEQVWLNKMVKEFQIDALISDNRFGLFHASIPCVFITHQLNILTGNRISDQIARKINYHYIDRFSDCWIPDEKENGYAGVLSHPEKFPATPVKYIGLLSRLKNISSAIKYDFLFLLSGPEPQRTIFENKIIDIIHQNNHYKIALVRGRPLGKNELTIKNADVYDHLTAAELNVMLASSRTVICRSGYSTVMDLLAIGKKAILVPTPGQNEQEYLAEYLNKHQLFQFISQENVNKNIFEIEIFDIQPVNNNIEQSIQDWLHRISSLQ